MGLTPIPKTGCGTPEYPLPCELQLHIEDRCYVHIKSALPHFGTLEAMAMVEDRIIPACDRNAHAGWAVEPGKTVADEYAVFCEDVWWYVKVKFEPANKGPKQKRQWCAVLSCHRPEFNMVRFDGTVVSGVKS